MSKPSAIPTQLDVAATLRGRKILFIGSTGFVGKVALAMLLDRYPDLEQLFVLVRPGAGSSSEERFFNKIVASPVFDPLREKYGAGTLDFLRRKCTPVAGDVGRPLCNFTDADFDKFGKLDAVVNVAGLVDFDPSLESAIRVNVQGTQHALAVAEKTSAVLVHVSTCFVAGNRDGDIWEDDPLIGYFPNRDELPGAEFSVERELADCLRTIAEAKAQADDAAHVSEFRRAARQRYLDDGRDPDDEKSLKLAIARERKTWVAEELGRRGMARAHHWGWPNTYTYTKALGDQICATSKTVRTCIVRPSIVESSLRFPFPGWNEGFTTTAPIAFLGISGHQHFPAGDGNLDLIPVDMVASGLIMATAATIAHDNAQVYQLASSDVAPFPVTRAVELLGLYKRRYYQRRSKEGKGNKLYNFIQSRTEPVAVDKAGFESRSTPFWQKLATRAESFVKDIQPRWGMPRLAALAEHTREQLAALTDFTQKTGRLFEQFMPFMLERHYTFRADQTRKLFERLAPPDQLALPWDPEKLDWRDYWMNIHVVGLERWIFPSLEEEFTARPKSVYTYHDLVEMFEIATRRNKERTALRLVAPEETGDRRYTYGDLSRLANQAAAALHTRKVAVGDKVLLVSESRPEWSITYFAVLKAGGTVVPVDPQATDDELRNILEYAKPRLVVVSEKARNRFKFLSERSEAEGPAIEFAELFATVATGPAPAHRPHPDDVASLIFTSGTTGRPKGVQLTHKNFTSLLSRLSSLFDIDKHDGLLSVLPLHHTFEFAAGLLLPLGRGAEVSYLDEVNPDRLREGLQRGRTTAMVGVPALWQLLHRKMRQPFQEASPFVSALFEQTVEQLRKLRDRLPPNFDSVWQAHLGKLLFWPIHGRLGGRLRLLISGGAALPVDVMKAFRGLGFHLYEGYGMTESAPVLTVARPGRRLALGSVGEPIPGVEVKIKDPDANGIGEVIAQGPNVMLGYFENPEATAETIQNGWLHTGDLGRIDEDGRLYIVGRRKEMILGASGENIYPDELEELYQNHALVKELSIVGLPQDGAGETVAMLVRVDDTVSAADGKTKGEIETTLHAHFAAVSSKLPAWKRVKIIHFTDRELPRTTTRKVKRRVVVEDIQRLERLAHQAHDSSEKLAAAQQNNDTSGTRRFIAELAAAVSNRKVDDVLSKPRLSDLGFDSLMYAELGSALSAAGVKVPDATDVNDLQTLDDLVRSVGKWGWRKTAERPSATTTNGKRKNGAHKNGTALSDSDEINVPGPVGALGRRLIDGFQSLTFGELFDSTVRGEANIPHDRSFLVVSNHASHLDMGLIKHALGDWGPRLMSVAAKDYFFDNPLKRAWFENFTNLVPMDRHGSLRESLRLAGQVIEDGHILLLFPEGTRSTDGIMTDFKPSVGYLALHHKRDILPLYLDGTYEALPKGGLWPQQRNLTASIGPPIRYDAMVAATRGMTRSEAYREVARLAEDAVRKLAPVGSPNHRAAHPGHHQRFGAETIMQTES